MRAPSVAHPQDQSPLFTTLPLEIRHHIYKQLWLDYGLTQHILAFNEKSYLLRFPCVLSPEELNRDPGSPAASMLPTPPTDAGDATDVAGATVDADGANENGVIEELQSHDDPGDIAGAIQDLSGGDFELPNNDPWCAHFACFRNCSQKWDHSFSSMYTACYRRRGEPDLRNSAILTTFLVCRRMYQEASEDLFTKMRFSFSGMVAMDIFLSEVPRGLHSRIQFVSITSGNMGSVPGASSTPDSRPPAQEVHDKVKASFPRIQELRLSLHPQRTGQPIPQKQDLEPLYALARELENLRKFEVFLPTNYEAGSEVRYGHAPNSFQHAPFTVKIVPPGWHENDDCRHFRSQ
ncbi:hypothetical protein KVR01_012239 [Diaporthe batatas]|uniref:uncharacterized protein n=1 Tax=Diaporthe batatas TaxID=748121 RepID=UPI001D047D80|nr:uncharacterized protein KVR01_012239 [Diaporthe batatas]KAG8157967.1 hypothetical protein KVR01_012239 [Diaporthe batatas]